MSGEPILTKDTELQFPNFTILKASAGSGKTHALSLRFVQFLLSEQIPYNQLQNILAITFSNNAAKEMKDRILDWLKKIYFADPDKTDEILAVTSLDKNSLSQKAEQAITNILSNYTDLQVRTIDSFMTSIFKSSALDLGFPPEFDIVMDNSELIEYAFYRYLRNVKPGTEPAVLIESIIQRIQEQIGSEKGYVWDPASKILEEIKQLYTKLSALTKPPTVYDYQREIEETKQTIADRAEKLYQALRNSSLVISGKNTFTKIYEAIQRNAYADLLDCGIKSNPVNQPKGNNAKQNEMYQRILSLWTELTDAIRLYREYHAKSFYYPYLKMYTELMETLNQVKRQEGTVFIEDISKRLVEYINAEIIPDVYFRLGDRIYHYLIDEFQDTSPIQWENLKPLIENSLATQGSLFIVGDTKQAIYGFRNADFQIMQRMVTGEVQPFGSVHQQVDELPINYRSYEKIVELTRTVFQGILPTLKDSLAEYRSAGERSGLTSYQQSVKDEHKNKGYVEIKLFAKNADVPEEKTYIQSLVQELASRGYRWSDIAILTYKNDKVTEISSWLNEISVPFISYSALDIRKQQVVGELIALLKFLDSPPDDLSFATFILGDIFQRALAQDTSHSISIERIHQFLFQTNTQKLRPIYTAFRTDFPELWQKYFDPLFRSVGYLPLYDLMTEIYRIYSILPRYASSHEATFIKLLEVIKDFEGKGLNSLGSFLTYSADEESEDTSWNIAVPKSVDAVSVMSIHKAKGLEFPVVISVVYDADAIRFDYVMDDSGENITVLKITKSLAEATDYLQQRYDQERLKECVNRLNTLYVAMTRAIGELYIIGVSNDEKYFAGEQTVPAKFPMPLLPISDYPPQSNKPLKTIGKERETPKRFTLRHTSAGKTFLSKQQDKLTDAVQERGELIHRILSEIEFLDQDSNLDQQLNGIIDKDTTLSDKSLDSQGLIQSLIPFLSNPDVKEYFTSKPGRRVLREQELVAPDGRLFRLDRIVLDDDRITAVSYKTGTESDREELYHAQVKQYLELVSAIYPHKPVEGYIGYIDLNRLVKI
ncbi:MAG: UvrD-helicase domain-containing protein [bacterium]|nr:UvrD-helicase domain-containing protein [bacterium]